MSLLFNMLFRLIIIFLPRSKHLLILWIQSPSAVILEPSKIRKPPKMDGHISNQSTSILLIFHIIHQKVIAVCVYVLVAQSCPTLCDPMDCSLPGSSIHGILQARILAWIAISFSRKSSWPRDWILVSHIAGWLLNELQFIQSNSGFHCKQFFPSPLWFITAKRDGLCL